MQTVAPARVSLMLGEKQSANCERQARMSSSVLAEPTLESLDRIGRIAGSVVPALDGRGSQAKPRIVDGVFVELGRQPRKLASKLTLRRRSRQKRSDHRETESRPAVTVTDVTVAVHSFLCSSFESGCTRLRRLSEDRNFCGKSAVHQLSRRCRDGLEESQESQELLRFGCLGETLQK